MKNFESYPRVRRWLLVSAVVALLAACGGGDDGREPILGGGALAPGGIPGAPAGAILPGAVCTLGAGPAIPTVTTSDPTNGNQFVPTSTTGVAGGGKLVTATFSLAMNAATINATTFTLTPLAGVALTPASVTYNTSTRVATLTTSAALLPDTTYTAVITAGVLTTPGGVAPACSYAWTFKTSTPASSGVGPINLGLATPLAIASAAGVSNTATLPLSHLNGDAVLDPTATCNAASVGATGTFGVCGGFAPTLTGTVSSPLFPDAGVTSGAIKADLNATYISLMPANLPGATVLGCGIIGTGGGGGGGVGCAGNATLPPGVYISATASTIGVTGVLTLDGGGDANARFVFQAPSALTTAAGAPGVPGSQIVLTNGAKASNVWWQVGSSATVGTYADFKGNILADTSITLGTNATSCGRLLAGAVTASGAFSFDSNVVSVPGHPSAPPGCN
jgi:hypothetical protein